MKYAKAVAGTGAGFGVVASTLCITLFNMYLDAEEKEATIKVAAFQKAEEAGGYKVALEAKAETITILKERLEQCEQ